MIARLIFALSIVVLALAASWGREGGAVVLLFAGAWALFFVGRNKP